MQSNYYTKYIQTKSKYQMMKKGGTVDNLDKEVIKLQKKIIIDNFNEGNPYFFHHLSNLYPPILLKFINEKYCVEKKLKDKKIATNCTYKNEIIETINLVKEHCAKKSITKDIIPDIQKIINFFNLESETRFFGYGKSDNIMNYDKVLRYSIRDIIKELVFLIKYIEFYEDCRNIDYDLIRKNIYTSYNYSLVDIFGDVEKLTVDHELKLLLDKKRLRTLKSDEVKKQLPELYEKQK